MLALFFRPRLILTGLISLAGLAVLAWVADGSQRVHMIKGGITTGRPLAEAAGAGLRPPGSGGKGDEVLADGGGVPLLNPVTPEREAQSLPSWQWTIATGTSVDSVETDVMWAIERLLAGLAGAVVVSAGGILLIARRLARPRPPVTGAVPALAGRGYSGRAGGDGRRDEGRAIARAMPDCRELDSDAA